MKVDGSDWVPLPEKSESEQLFDRLLFFRQVASMSAERLRITEELEWLLQEDQTNFAEYLSNVILIYKCECEPVLDIDEDDPEPEELEGFFYDINTTAAQYLYHKRIFILEYLQHIERLWNNKSVEEIAAKLKEAHNKAVSEIINAKKRIEKDFPILKNLTMKAIEDSLDAQKNEVIKKSLDEMRNDFIKNGIDV